MFTEAEGLGINLSHIVDCCYYIGGEEDQLAKLNLCFQTHPFQKMASSDDSDFEGLVKVSSVKKKKVENFDKVPASKKYKLEINSGKKSDKFGYKLKKGLELPYETILTG